MVQESERSSTPEKQLLSLIEDPKAAAAQGKMKRKALHLFSFDALRGRVSFLGERLKAVLTPKKFSLDLKNINRILTVAIVFLVITLVATVMRSIEKLNKIPDFGLGAARSGSEPLLGSEDNIKKLSSYLDKVRARDIFRFGGIIKIQSPEPVEEVPEPVAEAAPSLAEELLHSLSLVGIGWTEEPDVMIENTSTKKVYFLKRGDWIDGRIQVNAIFEDRVILSFDGKEAELR